MKALSHLYQFCRYSNGSALLFCCPVLQQGKDHLRVEHPFSSIALATVRGGEIAFDLERDRWPIYIDNFTRWGLRASTEDFRRVPSQVLMFCDIEESFDRIDREYEFVMQGARSELGAQFFAFSREVEPQNPKIIPPNALGLEERVRESVRFAISGSRLPEREHRVARQKQDFLEKQQIRAMMREPA